MQRNSKVLKSVGLSVAVHVLVVAAFSISLWLPRSPQAVPPQDTDRPIQAFAVDAAAVQAEVERQQALEAAARAAEEQRRRELAEQERAAREARQREEQRLQQLAREREQAQRRQQEEQARLAQLKQEQAREAERLKKLQAEKAAAEEAKRKAEEKARLERERKAREEAERQRAEEEKRKAEEARRKEEARKAEEAKRRAEEERRKAEEARRRAEEEQRRAQIAAEELAQKIRGAVPGWTNVVAAHVHRYWSLPPGSYAGREAVVEIRLALNGAVQSVRTVRSSGDPTFDRLAESTIQKASPLPMPGDADVARAFVSQGVHFTFGK